MLEYQNNSAKLKSEREKLITEKPYYEDVYKDNEKQLRRYRLKNSILEKYNIPIVRVKTTGSEEYKLL